MQDEKNKEKVLEEKIDRIKSYLKVSIRYSRDFLPRPFIVEIAGSPAAGKSRLITELDGFLRREGLRVYCPQEGAQAIRHIERTSPVYNIRTALYALTLLLDLSSGNQFDIVIFDRCIFDGFVWMMYHEKDGKLKPEEAAVLQAFFLSDFWSNFVDVAYFVICETEEAMRRRMRFSLTQKTTSGSNPKAIEALINLYKTAYGILSVKHKQLFLMETTHMSEAGMVTKVTFNILDIFNRKIG